ncbi:hypothetical protein SDC9_72600 [bioreactor metagenome]|uniref:DUF5666 domain-containing protein n=1 Tax=bioreactor metagenome TaxID=1076179 RepID=A0A644YCS9_9ZZZZ|nr:hypothetical protein [Oscillibacter sp.]
MKLKSTLSLLCVTGLMAMALAGCGSSSAGTASTPSAASKSASASTSSESSSSEVIGQVQSISDKTVTLLLGDLTDAGQNQNGAPAQPAGSSSSSASLSSSPNSSQAPSNGQPGQKPSEQPSQPDGKQPDAAQPGGAKIFTAGTETKDITLTDDTAIKVESVTGETDGSIADVKEGAILDVTLGDNNTAVTVIIKNVMPENLTAPDNTNASTPAVSSSSSQSANS